MKIKQAVGKKIKKSKARVAFEIFNYMFLALFAFLCLLPVLHVFFASLSDPKWLNTQSGLILWPVGFNLEGYKLVFANKQLISGFLNTVFYVVTSVGIGMYVTVTGAYILSRKNLLWGNVLMFLVSLTMLFSGGIIPMYILIQKLHMFDTRWSIILPGCVSAFNLIMVRTAFSTLPESLEESAKLDGASDMVILFRILLPLIKATIATVTLYYIIAMWNSWFQASMYLQDRDKFPMQLVLREILIINDTSSSTQTQTASDMAVNRDLYRQLVKYSTIIISCVPMFAVYPFVMKYFKSGVMIGSIKG